MIWIGCIFVGDHSAHTCPKLIIDTAKNTSVFTLVNFIIHVLYLAPELTPMIIVMKVDIVHNIVKPRKT